MRAHGMDVSGMRRVQPVAHNMPPYTFCFPHWAFPKYMAITLKGIVWLSSQRVQVFFDVDGYIYDIMRLYITIPYK